MMTVIARLCALCAVCTLCEAMLPQEHGRDSVRLVGGLLMLRLFLSQAQEILLRMSNESDLQNIFEILIK